jgi:hypothetical protein
VIVVDMIGWACAAAVLVAYALVIRTPEAVTGRRYLALNLVGSAGLTVSGAGHAAWPSAALNLLWLCLALHAYRGRGGSRQSDVVVSATRSEAAQAQACS